MKSVNDMSKNELNCVINSDGTPKYSAGKLSHMAIDVLRKEATEAIELRSKPVKSIGGKRGRKYGNSTNKASAMVKKSNLLKSIAEGNKTIAEVLEIVSLDSFLINLWPNWESEIKTGVRPSKKEVTTELSYNLSDYNAQLVKHHVETLFNVETDLVKTEKGFNVVAKEKINKTMHGEITYFILGLLTEK